MDLFLAQPPLFWIFFLSIGLLAGFVKGAVGFAMPMVIISGLGSFTSPELALASLIVPTMLTNLVQALRNGARAAIDGAKLHWRFISIALLFIIMSAQMVRILPQWGLFLALGIPVFVFAVLQLAGWRLRIKAQQRRMAELGLGSIAGIMGGVSGVWGPPTVMYLTALDVPKAESLRVQGVIYGAGAVMLLGAHLQSGVLSAQSLPFSLAMIVPTSIGLATGMALGDRLDQNKFRRLTLLVLVIAGLNLIRRGVFG